MNLRDLWRIIAASKWIVLFTTLVGGIAAAGYAFQLPSIFVAEVTLLPATTEESGRFSALGGELGNLASMTGINLGSSGGNSVEQSLAVLKSRAFTDAFIKDENLMPILFDKQWDSTKKAWRNEDGKKPPTLRTAYQVFNSKVRTISQDKKTGVVTLTISWTNPQQASDWANLLIERLNRHAQLEAIAEAEKSIVYLNKQLQATSVMELREAMFRLIESQTKNIMLANVRGQFAFKVIDPAVVPEEKAKPNRRLISIMGTVLGLIVGLVLAFGISGFTKSRVANTEVV